MSDNTQTLFGVFLAVSIIMIVIAHVSGPEFALFSGFIFCLILWIVDRVVCLMEGINPNDEPTDLF